MRYDFPHVEIETHDEPARKRTLIVNHELAYVALPRLRMAHAKRSSPTMTYKRDTVWVMLVDENGWLRPPTNDHSFGANGYMCVGDRAAGLISQGKLSPWNAFFMTSFDELTLFSQGRRYVFTSEEEWVRSIAHKLGLDLP